MNLTQEDMQEIVKDATANLKAQLTSDLTRRLDAEVTHAAANTIREYVQEWVKENVLPDVEAILIEGKTSLVNTASASANAMCDELSKSMTETLKVKLSKSWDRSKIFEALFK